MSSIKCFFTPRSSSIDSGRPITSNTDSDDVILAPASYNPNSDLSNKIEEFQYKGKQYVRCDAIAKHTKNTKK